MQQRKKNKFDRMEIGALVGLAVPIVIFFVVYLANETHVSFYDYMKGLWRLQALIKLGSLCVFANVAAFWGFLHLKYERAARGVLGATIVYAFVVLISRAV
jgi:hypothetical protein